MAKQCRYNIMSEQQINHRIHWPPWVIRDHRTGAHNDASAKRQTSKKLQPTARANPRLHGRIILRTHCFSNLSPVVLVSSVVLTPPPCRSRWHLHLAKLPTASPRDRDPKQLHLVRVETANAIKLKTQSPHHRHHDDDNTTC